MSEFEGMPHRLFGVLVAMALIFSPLDARSASTEANELFVNAVLLYRDAAELPPDERDATLRQVRDMFDQILAEHPDSDPAEQILNNPAPAGIALADLPPSREARDATDDRGGGSTSAPDADPWIVRAAENTAARLCDDAACRRDVAWSIVEWAIENGIDGTLDEAFTPKTTFLVDEIVLGPGLRQAFLRKTTDWPATLRPAGELGGDIVFALLTLFVGEWLAQHYEDNGYRDLASATRAGFAPLVSTMKAAWAAKALGASGAGLAATNIVLWTKNLHEAHKLGEALLADRYAGRDVESQLIDIQNDITSIQQTLLQDRKTGKYWTDDVQGDPLTEKERDFLIDNLELFQDLADRLVRANFRLNEQWLTSSVADLSIWLARSVDRLSEPTALNPTTPAVHPSLDIALPNNDGFAPQLDTVPPAVPPQTSQGGAWEVQADPDVALKPGEQARGFAVSTDGSASFRGQSLFSGYRAPEPDYQRLTIFVDDPERRAVALFMRDGAERIALVDLEAGTVLNDAPRPYWRYGPTDDVIWDPSGRYAALRLPMAEYSTGLGIFELATGRYATIPDRAFDATALDSWLADSLETRPDGTVAVKVAFEKLDDYGTPIASDGTPPATRIIEIEAFFDGSVTAPHSESASDETAGDPETGAAANQVWDPRIVVSEETGIFNRTYGDLVSPIDELRAAGVSDRAVAFSRAFAEATDSGKAGEFVAVDFTELGAVDLVRVEPAYTRSTSSPLHSYVLTARQGTIRRLSFPVEMNRNLGRYATDRTSRRVLAGQPDPWIVDHYVTGHRFLPSGAQRFVLQGPVSGSCRVCEWIGHAIVYVDVDERGDVLRHNLVGVIADSAVPDEEITPADIVTRPDLQQYMLNKFGYDAGPMDGAVGPRTRQAIAALQRDHCLTVTSSLTGPVVRALARSNPLTPPACSGGTPDESTPASDVAAQEIGAAERVPDQTESIGTANSVGDTLDATRAYSLTGRYGNDPLSCSDFPTIVEADGIKFYEHRCAFDTPIPNEAASHETGASCNGEGNTYRDTLSIELTPGGSLVVGEAHQRQTFSRCTGASASLARAGETQQPFASDSNMSVLGPPVGAGPMQTLTSRGDNPPECSLKTALPNVDDFTWTGECRDGEVYGAGRLDFFRAGMLQEMLQVGPDREMGLRDGVLRWRGSFPSELRLTEQTSFGGMRWANATFVVPDTFNVHSKNTLNWLVREAARHIQQRGFQCTVGARIGGGCYNLVITSDPEDANEMRRTNGSMEDYPANYVSASLTPELNLSVVGRSPRISYGAAQKDFVKHLIARNRKTSEARWSEEMEATLRDAGTRIDNIADLLRFDEKDTLAALAGGRQIVISPDEVAFRDGAAIVIDRQEPTDIHTEIVPEGLVTKDGGWGAFLDAARQAGAVGDSSGVVVSCSMNIDEIPESGAVADRTFDAVLKSYNRGSLALACSKKR